MKIFLKSIRWYSLALLTWFIIILMFLSIILIPLYFYLKNHSRYWEWWWAPFDEAYYKINREC